MALSRIGDSSSATSAAVDARIFKQGRDTRGLVFRTLLQLGLAIAILVLAVLLYTVVRDGWDTISGRLGSFLSGELRSQSDDSKLGIFQGLRGSLWIALFVIFLAFPIGIGSAIYLEEYAPRNRLTRLIELTIRNLAGVPSVVYGLLGLAVFVELFSDVTRGSTVSAAGITLSILVLPIVIITSAEAIRAVPQSLREAGYGLGATKWEVTRSHVLPYAAPGILTGTLLSLSRAIGEAAPLIVIGAVTGRLGEKAGLFDINQLQERFTAMPVVITDWVQKSGRDDGFFGASNAGIIVLLVVVLVLNSVAIVLRNRFEKRRG